MSRTATQLAGNASSIFQAWLDLKQQAGGHAHTSINNKNVESSRAARRRRAPSR